MGIGFAYDCAKVREGEGAVLSVLCMLEFLFQEGNQMLVEPESGESEVHPFALEMPFVWVAFRWLDLAEELDGASIGRFAFSVGKKEARETAIGR